ncbi:MAG: signal peptide peptidase SppA [Bacteroidales bacterium]|nr:signal peptide peptidase SppA [Bacteroidales bacterium]
MSNFYKTALASFLGILAALIILALIVFGIIGVIASDSEKNAIPPGNVILKISGAITEQKVETFNFNPLNANMDMSSSCGILSVVRAIDVAASDSSVKMIYIRPDDLLVSISSAEELRKALSRFRDSGKPVIAYMDAASVGTYYLASVADKVILNRYADVMFSGMSSNILYFKDLIDHLGIDVQLIRHGKYKSAGEPFIKNSISQENREQYECMLGTIWDTMTESIAQSRDFSREDFCNWVDNLGIADAGDAKAKGIVDELWFKDELEDYLCNLMEVDNADDLKIAGIAEYAATKVKPDIRTREKIAVIYADGEIVMGDSQSGEIGDNFAREIAKVRKDSTVKAVVFRVNSPGGSVQASAIIKHEIELLKKEKPVVASYGDYAASGGYWISCGCDKIFSDRTTLTGSIGVFGLLPSFGNALRKNLHLNVETVSTNSHGALVDGFNPLDAQEVAWMQNMIENTYTEFTGLVADGRGMSREAVDEIAQGRVWAGGNAVTIGLVDEIGTLQDALNYAAAVADLEKYQLVEYPAPVTAMERLMKMLQGKSASIDVLPEPFARAAKCLQDVSSIEKPLVEARMETIPMLCTK